jgi:branched-chain amino acid transport system ATP-binding protein
MGDDGTVTSAGPLLEVVGLTVTFGGVHAVHDVDLAVAEGAFVGLIGPNGAGKTTLIDAVTGFVAPSAGSVRFAGAELGGATPAERSSAPSRASSCSRT